MAKIEDQSTEKLSKSLGTIKWSLPLLIVAAILSLGAILYDWFIHNEFNVTGLPAAFLACLFFSLHFYTQRKKIINELRSQIESQQIE